MKEGKKQYDALPYLDAAASRMVHMAFARVGMPKEIYTDLGSNFTSHLRASLYHPQIINSNGYCVMFCLASNSEVVDHAGMRILKPLHI